jgi:hypothetical protein
VAGHQPHPRCRAPQEPPVGLLHPPAHREPPAGPLRALAMSVTLQPSAAGLLRALTMLRPSADDPHHSKPQERPPVGVGRPKCPTNKNNDKIYQMKQSSNNQ